MDINEPPARISPACERRNKEFNWSGLKHVLYLQNKDNKKKNHNKNYQKKNHHKEKNHDKKNYFVRKKYDTTLLHAFRKCFITDSV